MKVFVINPGSTSTKVALYENDSVVFSENIEHTQDQLKNFSEIPLQAEFRAELINEVISSRGIDLKEISIFMGRGGMFHSVMGGAYLVDDDMTNLIMHGDIEQHASNLGGLLAKMLADKAGVNAFVYDCVSVNELDPICKITGIPEIERQSYCHALNSREMARRYAFSKGQAYEDVKCIVAHLGGGFSFSAHRDGRIIDSISDDAGAFAPERSGSVPVMYIIDMCYSGQYTYNEMKRKVRGLGGLRSLLGTSDCRAVEARIEAGDTYAKEIYDAMIFQIAKGIHMVSTIMAGDIDTIILTGGVAYSKYIKDKLLPYIEHLAPVTIMPGEHEMSALASAGCRILNGEKYHTLSGKYEAL